MFQCFFQFCQLGDSQYPFCRSGGTASTYVPPSNQQGLCWYWNRRLGLHYLFLRNWSTFEHSNSLFFSKWEAYFWIPLKASLYAFAIFHFILICSQLTTSYQKMIDWVQDLVFHHALHICVTFICHFNSVVSLLIAFLFMWALSILLQN